MIVFITFIKSFKFISFSMHFTPHCWGLLVFLRSLSTIHSSHQSLEQMHWFEAIFKMFGSAVFEAIEVKGHLRKNFEAAASKFCDWAFWHDIKVKMIKGQEWYLKINQPKFSNFVLSTSTASKKTEQNISIWQEPWVSEGRTGEPGKPYGLLICTRMQIPGFKQRLDYLNSKNITLRCHLGWQY